MKESFPPINRIEISNSKADNGKLSPLHGLDAKREAGSRVAKILQWRATTTESSKRSEALEKNLAFVTERVIGMNIDEVKEHVVLMAVIAVLTIFLVLCECRCSSCGNYCWRFGKASRSSGRLKHFCRLDRKRLDDDRLRGAGCTIRIWKKRDFEMNR